MNTSGAASLTYQERAFLDRFSLVALELAALVVGRVRVGEPSRDEGMGEAVVEVGSGRGVIRATASKP